ncbi:MAG: CarD family transcriptional regulator [Bdellovibrionales bacterium]|nr:CarD family transcriptional regulator [Bdellovibrionales bacterium]
MAKQTFKVGDKVVCPPFGVGLIEGIETKSVATFEQQFYVIALDKGFKHNVATNQIESVGLRKVVDSKTIEKVYKILKDRDVTVDKQTWNRRQREYTQKLKTGSVFEIAEVIRDLSVLQVDKELSYGERKMLDSAKSLLVKEISIAKSRPEDVVKEEIHGMCQAAA